MKKIFILLLSSLISYASFCCLNEYHINKSGKSSIDAFAMEDIYFVRGFSHTRLEKELQELRTDTTTDKEYVLYNRNNIAVHLIKLGRLSEAKNLLDSLLKVHPNEYNVVVNLGTLYELMGENKKALEFINRAIKINKDSHSGSEWFHVKVLEYKLRKRNTAQIPGDDILQFKTTSLNNDDLANGISYQLKERIPFTPTPDRMMAKILLEYGDFLADSISIEGAYVIYGIAEEYDADKVLPLQKRKEDLLAYFKKSKGVKIPDHKRYFVTVKQDEFATNTGEVTSEIIEKGLEKLFKTGNKKEQLKTPKPVWPYFIAGALVLLVVIFFARRKKANP